MKPSILSTARLSFSLATALAALLVAQSASAQNGTWTQTTLGPFNWDDIANWSSGAGPIADGVDSTASFVANFTAGQTVNLNNAKTIGNITFTDTTTSSNDLIISGANTLTLDVTTGSPVISVTNTDRLLSISSVVAGGDGLTKGGPGVLSLTGPNTYTGVTSILNGRLAASSLGALGSTSSIILGTSNATTLSSGATGLTITAPITTANSGVNSTIAFGVSTSAVGNFSLNGAIGGSGNVVFSTVGSSGNFLQSTILGAAGTYTGTTTITSASTGTSNSVKAGLNNALPTGTVLTINGGNGPGAPSVRHTAYDLNGFNQALAGLTNTTGLTQRSQRVINTSATLSTLTIDNTSDYTFSGNIGGNTNLGVPAVNLGLTKGGSGIFTLGSSNLFTGPTLINAGTLRLTTAGTINASSGITINGSTAKLLQTSSTAITPTVTLTQGTLTGSSTVSTVNVGNATGGIISNNNGVAGAALTIGALTFDGAATVNTFGNASTPIVTTSLASNVAGTVTINPSAASWAAGTYDLISYGGASITGGGFAQFALGTVTGVSPRQSVALDDSGTAIRLTVGADDSPYWVGDGDGKWNLASTNNWKLVSNSSATTFLSADNVLFNDSATGAGPINVDIDTANVSPTSTTFNNSTKDYVVNSSSTFGIATGSLTKSGNGSLTLNPVNNFTGDTTLSGGSLIIGGAGQLGGGSYAGAIANDGSFIYSSSAVQTLAGIVSGTGSITQNGSGNLTLSGANTFSGGLKVKGSTVVLANSTAAGTGTIDFDTGSATNASVQFSGALTVANPITISSGSIGTNTLANIGAGAVVLNGAVTINSGTTLTVDSSSSNNSSLDLGTGLITGDGSLVATGTSTGNFIFRGASTYTGGTTLGGAGVFIPVVSSTGAGAGTTDGVFGTGTLTLGDISSRSTNTADITVGNTLILGGNLTVPTATSEKTLTFSGPATLTGNRTISSSVVAAGKSLTFSGVIDDGVNSFGIIKQGGGVLLLSGANTYDGATIVNTGTLAITHNNSLGTPTGSTTINGNLTNTGTILSFTNAPAGLTLAEPLNLAGSALGRVRISNNNNFDHTLSGAINVSSDTNQVAFWSDDNGSYKITGNITGTMTNGALFVLRGTSANPLNQVIGDLDITGGNLSKTDAGTWLVGAPGKTYNWNNTTVALGTLKMGETGVLPDATILSMGNGNTAASPILDLNGFNQTVAGISYSGQGTGGTGTRTITSASSAVLTVNNGTDSTTTGTNTGSDNIVLTGALSIIKQGTARLDLNGVNTYSGNTTVNEGILSLTKADSATDANTGNDASTVTIAADAGATLDLSYSGTDEVNALFIGGVQKAAGVWGSATSGAANTDPKLTGSGTLTVATGPAAGYIAWATTNAGGEGAQLDFDKDGVSNGVEYFMNAPAGFTANPQLNASKTITWTNGGNIPASAYGTQFVIQTSSDLTNWVDVLVGDLTTNSDGPGGSLTYTLTGGTPRFVRLKVSPN